MAKLLIAVLLVILTGCGSSSFIKDSGRIDNIYRDEIMTTGPMKFSCFIWEGGERYSLKNFYPLRVSLVADLEPGERIWIRCKDYKADGDNFRGGEMEIHCPPEEGLRENEEEGDYDQTDILRLKSAGISKGGSFEPPFVWGGSGIDKSVVIC